MEAERNGLPNGWVETEFKNIVSFVIGGDWGKDPEKSFKDETELVSCIRGSEIKKWNSDKGRTASIRKLKPASAEKRMLQLGDILLEISGGGPDQPVGRVVYIDEESLKINANFKKVCTNFLRLVRVDSLTNRKFIKIYLDHIYISGEVLKYQGGSNNLRNLKYKEFELLNVPLPPLPEQNRIVVKLDALFGSLDQLNARLDTIPTLLKNFKQAVLTQAVTGKLTEEWRKGKELESLEVLFKKINLRREKHKSKKVRDNKLQVRNDLNLFDLPNSWKWCNLNYILDDNDAFRYGVVQPGNDVENEQKIIRVKDISKDKILINNLRGISFEVDSGYKTARVKEGDLLISIVGTIGRSVIVPKECKGYNIARALAKVPISDFNAYYVKLFIDSEFGETWLVGDTREVARKTLNLVQLKTLPIPIPSTQEQTEIVNRVERLFSRAEALEARYHALKEKVAQLPQAILAKAFKGELVEQLPTDGDAKELLQEILELKKASASRASASKRKKANYPAKPTTERLDQVAENSTEYKQK